MTNLGATINAVRPKVRVSTGLCPLCMRVITFHDFWVDTVCELTLPCGCVVPGQPERVDDIPF